MPRRQPYADGQSDFLEPTVKILAAIALIWLVCMAIGAVFSIIGKIIWVAILLSLIAVAWGFLSNKT